MRMKLIPALLVLTAPALVHAETVRVERYGHKFEYAIEKQADGTRLITGRELNDNKSFTFLVKGDRVKGDVDGMSVTFRAPRQPAKPTLIASR